MKNYQVILWIVLRWAAVALVGLCLFFIFKNLFKGKPQYKVGEIITINGIPLEVLEVKYSKKRGWYYCFLYKEKRYCYSQREIARLTLKITR
jgi:hypothetical protein